MNFCRSVYLFVCFSFVLSVSFLKCVFACVCGLICVYVGVFLSLYVNVSLSESVPICVTADLCLSVCVPHMTSFGRDSYN